MTSPLRRLCAAVLFVALLASACGSSDDQPSKLASEESIAAATADTKQADPTLEPAATTAAEPTSIPVSEDDATADTAIAGLDDADNAESDAEPDAAALPPSDPASTALGFIRSRFNLDPPADEIACIVEESTGNDVLSAALTNPIVAVGEVDDTQLRVLTNAINGCVDSLGLGSWATQAVGPQGEVAETAPACFAERFDDAESGDLTFTTFAAVTYQYRVDQAGVPAVTDALVTCTPLRAMADFFATTAEEQSGFTTVINRECLNAELEAPGVAEMFWGTLIEGLQPPIAVMAPIVAQCEEEPPEAPPGPTDALPSDFVAWSGTGALSTVLPSARVGIYDQAPPMSIDPASSYQAEFVTGGGTVRIRLFADTAPVTVNNFVSLARDGYYDGTVFHRVIAEFMAQGGDPTGTGTGGPGYSFADEFNGGPSFDRKGLLAMANSGPSTNGSQFFITFVPTDWLDNKHTIFGEVIEGIEIVDAIPISDSGQPPQIIESVTIIES